MCFLRFRPSAIVLMLAVILLTTSVAQKGATQDDDPVVRPRVFLDKSPRIVWYQLNRLTNQQLLMVERKTGDPKYAPVYTAILIRPGMSMQHRESALAALEDTNQSDSVTELLAVFASLDEDDKSSQRVGRQLATLLLRQPLKVLVQHADRFAEAADGDGALQRATALAGLVAVGRIEQAEAMAQRGPVASADFLLAISLIPDLKLRRRSRQTVLDFLVDGQPKSVRRKAIRALSSVMEPGDDTFATVAPFIMKSEFRDAAVKTLLAVPTADRSREIAERLIVQLVEIAEATVPAERTTDPFIESMQLAEQLLVGIPLESARRYRDRLREVSVRVVLIHTVEEEMRYDTPFFAVEAGRSVQVVLQNEDLMPHNLVITAPDALQEVAQMGALLPKGEGAEAKQYVPKSPLVLFATEMVPAGKQERLTFTAPSEPGEYPFVCTFPRHWMRMYGVMVVVEDLDEWLKNPVEPSDPIGSNRAFVKSWMIDDFPVDLQADLRGRSLEIGERLFVEATCALCHKVNGTGGAVGPELTDVLKRWKGDHRGILREILDPSHKIDPKYAVQVIYTVDGLIVSGIVDSEDKEAIAILENPEAKKPTVIAIKDVDERVRSSKSMMPKALLDRFSRDEILEILNYLEQAFMHAHEHKH
ncbi:MAG TPA: c-type cytochrome [Planctomycetaceae bacterium]|nr:c-type cytochrome [Planctomycetaceae bacterium]